VLIPKALRGAGSGLSGFPDAVNAAFPGARLQLCIIHMVRNSLKYVPWKDYKVITVDLKRIYQSTAEQDASLELDRFADTWGHKYPQISKSWRAHWPHLITLFDFPADIRKVIYMTSAIESLNSVIRKSVKTRKLFPNDGQQHKLFSCPYKRHPESGVCRLGTGKQP